LEGLQISFSWVRRSVESSGPFASLPQAAHAVYILLLGLWARILAPQLFSDNKLDPYYYSFTSAEEEETAAFVSKVQLQTLQARLARVYTQEFHLS
jgi:hypothetical protein